MIKAIIITLMSAGALGTGAHTLSPQMLEMSAGPMRLSAGTDGVKTTVAPTSEFAVALHLESGKAFTLRF